MSRHSRSGAFADHKWAHQAKPVACHSASDSRRSTRRPGWQARSNVDAQSLFSQTHGARVKRHLQRIMQSLRISKGGAVKTALSNSSTKISFNGLTHGRSLHGAQRIQKWIGLSYVAIAASLNASESVGWAWHVLAISSLLAPYSTHHSLHDHFSALLPTMWAEHLVGFLVRGSSPCHLHSSRCGHDIGPHGERSLVVGPPHLSAPPPFSRRWQPRGRCSHTRIS